MQETTKRTGEALAWATGVGEVALALAVLAVSVWLKCTVDAHGPLWLDEAWSAAIAGTHPFAAFAHQAWLDVNPPLYFLLLHGWTSVFGLSAGALRSLSLLISLLVPLAAAGLRTPGLSGPERLTWAAVLGVWGQAILYAQEARGYALLSLVVVVQLVAYVQLLRRPERGRAWLWTLASCLALLTHYHAVVLTGVQGLLLLAVLRGRALRLWPALAGFLPALAWMAVHLPRVLVFTRPEVAWYAPLDAWLIEQALDVAADGWPVLAATVAAVVAGVTVERALRRRPTRFSPGEGALWTAVAASVLGGMAVLALGAVKPSFTPRYMVAFGPGVLLGLVMACRNLSADGAKLGRMAVLAIVTVSALHLAWTQSPAGRRAFEFQTASEWLMEGGVRRMTVLWDNPTDLALAPEESQALFGVFFKRAGRPVVVRHLAYARGRAPQPALLASLREPGDGFLWMYDNFVPGTAATDFPQTLDEVAADDPGLACRDFAGGHLGVWACLRVPPVRVASPSASAPPR